MNTISSAAIFLINTIFDLYLYIVILRLVLPMVRADYHNPISQLAIKLTDPILIPIKKYIPNAGVINISAVILLFLVDGLKLSLLVMSQYHTLPNIFGLIIWVVGDILEQAISLMFIAIIVVSILSWVGQNVVNPIIVMLHRLTEPYLIIFRRFIPPISGLDLSPIAALIGLSLLTRLVAYPIKALGFGLI